MASFGYLDTFYAYQFLRRLVKPFEKWEAYRAGVIDKEGKILVPDDKRTEEQRDSFKYFDLLVRNLKLLMAKVPGGSTRIASYAAAIWLLREYRDIDPDQIENSKEKFVEFLKEEIANTANPAGIAGLDNPPKFAGHKIFDVKGSTMAKIRHGKYRKDRYSKYLEEEDNCDEIREYCRSNPKESVIFRHKDNGEMMFFKRK